ncbi:putative membrane protein, partial [Vibrio parahaemolyticus AQ3810]
MINAVIDFGQNKFGQVLLLL